MRKINKIDKKAWLRIIEAFLAVLIITGAVITLLSRQKQTDDISDIVYSRQRKILDIISKNDTLRKGIILGDNTEVDKTISQLLPPTWAFATNICSINDICPNPGDYEDKEVYATEIIITSTLESYSPKKLRFFVWVR